MALKRDHNIDLGPEEHRRNVTVEGVPLTHLVGRQFWLGETLLEATRLSIPCRHIEEITGKAIFDPLINRSGLELQDPARRHRPGRRHRAERGNEGSADHHGQYRRRTASRTAAPDIKLFTLVDPDHWELPPFRPGAHIDLHLPVAWCGPIRFATARSTTRAIVVAVKRERDGRGGSAQLHDDIEVGDIIGVSLPRGGIELDADVTRFTFVAGGIGVTPFLSAAASSDTDRSVPDFTLHLMARGEVPLRVCWLHL